MTQRRLVDIRDDTYQEICSDTDNIQIKCRSTDIDRFNVGFILDSEYNRSRIDITYNDYHHNWFGFVFNNEMKGFALIYTSHQFDLTKPKLYPYSITSKTKSGVNYMKSPSRNLLFLGPVISADWIELQNYVNDNEVKLSYWTGLDNTPWNVGTESIPFRYAIGSKLNISKHTSTSETVNINLKDTDYEPTISPSPIPTVLEPPNPTVSDIYFNTTISSSGSHSKTYDKTNEAVIGAVVGAFIVVFAIIACIIFIFKRNILNTICGYTNEIDNDVEVDNIILKTGENDHISLTTLNDIKYEKVAASAPIEEIDENIEGIDEGITNVNVNVDSYHEIKEWFNNCVDLQENNEKYFQMFITNGFDHMNLIKEIKEIDLNRIGITKLGHKNRIMVAIENLQK